MDPNSDWSLPRDRWTETNTHESYYRNESQYQDDVPGYPSQQYHPPPMNQYHPQFRNIRPQIHSQNSVPSFTEYQGRVAPVHNPGPRCLSQPAFQDRNREDQPTQDTEPLPADRRCSENEFSSDMDLTLFVAATSGFTPDSPLHRSFGDAPSWRDQQLQPRLEYSQPQQRPQNARAYSSYTNTTLAHHPVPSHSTPHLPIRQPQPRSPAFVRQGPNVWQERLETEPYAWQAHVYDDEPPPADELPDYEQSQAEMQNKNRIEAKRRAEELQRRWRQRHSR
ncbi:hypothetical protein E4T50_04491 [Aureobasidium sp. EXF-12298]|jgi:hypothetical protein|nr:hypothetical protein E4T50_04491 [Aureobasidium sp. EXF-12298]KAI4757481.1 hypothetical protein E4T51_09464 [Aureobasidium sp. EXF-12344]KAI4774490.1 hypothetical protein E4T52_10559 [Aureobasidium sp. EXF-3400]